MKSSPIQLPDDYVLKKCTEQSMLKMKGTTKMSMLNFEKEKPMTLREFRELAKSFEKPGLSQTELENRFWEDVQQRHSNTRSKDDLNLTYGIDNEQSLFVNGFPYWNLNEMTENESVIHGGKSIHPLSQMHIIHLF